MTKLFETSWMNDFKVYERVFDPDTGTTQVNKIDGKSEYFVRVNKVLAHLMNKDKLNRDDGDLEGQIYNNFHVEMSCIKLLLTISTIRTTGSIFSAIIFISMYMPYIFWSTI